MNRPNHLETQREELLSPRRVAIVGAVGALHVAFVYALVSGLATRVVMELPHVLKIDVQPQREEQKPPPPPPVELKKPEMPEVTMPVIQIQAPPPPQQHAVTAVVAPPSPPQPVASPVVAPPPPAPPPPAPTPPRAVAGTHTIPPYPELSRRLNEQGTVQLAISIAADGRITNAQVTQSSGSERLDQAAVEWVTQNWRYAPATQEGKAVPATVHAAVVFNLQTAR